MSVLRRPIFLILFVAIILRLWGIGYALPQFFVNDERANIYGALKMLELRTLVPAWHEEEFRKVLYYSPLPSYFYLVTLTPVIGVHYLISDAADLAEYKNRLAIDSGFIFLAARILVALIGVANIYVIYLFSRKLFQSERAGLLAAVFLSLSFFHVQLSHVTRHWLIATFLIYLAWLAVLGIYRTGALRYYLGAGIAAGLGVGTNSASAVAMVPLTLAHILRDGSASFIRRLFGRRLIISLAVFAFLAAILIALYPYGFTQGEVGPAGTGFFLGGKWRALAAKSFSGWLAFLWEYFKLLLRYEWPIFITALVGGILFLRRDWRWVVITTAFVAVYLTLLYLFFVRIPRGMIFILPGLAAFAGYGLDRLILWCQNRFRPALVSIFLIFGFCFLIFFAWPLAVVLRYDYLLSRDDTRILAKNWIEREISPGSKILTYLPTLRLNNTPEGVRQLDEIDSSALRASDRAILALGKAPSPAYAILNLHFLTSDIPLRSLLDPAAFRAMGYRYLAVEYLYPDQRDLDPQARSLASQGRRVARFDQFGAKTFEYALDIRGEVDTVRPEHLFFIDRFGPIVEIYEL